MGEGIVDKRKRSKGGYYLKKQIEAKLSKRLSISLKCNRDKEKYGQLIATLFQGVFDIKTHV